MLTYRLAYWLALLIPTGLLSGALISEHVFGLFPCEMCIWQRWPHAIAIILAAGALLLRHRSWSKFILIDAALAILISGLIGGFHAGVEYGWWEGITTCATAPAAGSDMLDSIMNAPLVRCDVAPWSLFGISLAGYNFLLSVGGAMLIFIMMIKGRRTDLGG